MVHTLEFRNIHVDYNLELEGLNFAQNTFSIFLG